MEVIKKKIASLKAELEKRDNAIAKRESELAKLNDDNDVWEKKNLDLQEQLDGIDNDLDNTDNEFMVVQKQLSEAVKEREIIEREFRQMKNRTQNNGQLIDSQHEHLDRAKTIAEDADHKFEEANTKLKMLEDDIEKLEEDAEMLEVKNTELSGECKLMGSTLKSFQAMESSMTDKEVKSEDEIGSITAALEKSSSECAEMIKKRDELTMLADDLETELAEATAEKISAVDSLDNTVRELGSI